MIRTSTDLCNWILENIEPTDKTAEDEAIWFVAVQNAISLSDCGIKGIAALLTEGIKPQNTMESVDNYLETIFYEDEEEFWEENESLLIQALYSHFGIN
jgi:hypothetical protein